KIAGVILCLESERMATRAKRSEEDARVLDPPVGIKQLRTNDTNFRPARMLQQPVEPVCLVDLHVIIEKQKKLPIRNCRAAVVEAGPVKGFRDINNLIGVPANETFPFRFVGRNIVNADNLEIAVSRLGA